MNPRNLAFQKFGHLTVLDFDDSSLGTKHKKWFVQCDCGTVFSARENDLVAGRTISCGCGIALRNDLTGKVFGELTAIKYDIDSGKEGARWICKCSCGKLTSVPAKYLLSGDVKSCGCLRTYDDLTGKRFGRLIAIRKLAARSSGSVMYLCRCNCGNETEASASNLCLGKIKSCGCLRREDIGNRTRKYTTEDERSIASIWYGMKRRCYDPSVERYPLYGGAGVYICDEWLNDVTVFVKWSLTNGYAPGLTIDRYPDRHGPYAPWNCRWASAEEQANNRSTNVYIEIDGITHTKAEWAKLLGVDPKPLYKLTGEVYVNRVKEIANTRGIVLK